MRRVPTLMRRELIAYFRSPMVYCEAAGLLGIVTLATWGGLGRGPKELVPGIMGFASFLMMFIVPILTMRLLAHEKDTGAMEVLVTDPVTDWDIVLGKFLAAVLALWAILLPLMLFPVMYTLFGKGQFAADVAWYKPWAWLTRAGDIGPIMTGALSVALLGVLFVSVGLFASSLSGNQAIGALVGFGLILVLWVFGWVGQLVNTGQAAELIESLSLYKRQELLLQGKLDTRPVFLFLSTAALMLYLTVRSVESRKWR